MSESSLESAQPTPCQGSCPPPTSFQATLIPASLLGRAWENHVQEEEPTLHLLHRRPAVAERSSSRRTSCFMVNFTAGKRGEQRLISSTAVGRKARGGGDGCGHHSNSAGLLHAGLSAEPAWCSGNSVLKPVGCGDGPGAASSALGHPGSPPRSHLARVCSAMGNSREPRASWALGGVLACEP